MKLAGFMDLVFPRACAGCGKAVGEEALYLCWDCLSRIPVIHPPFCSICGNPVDGVIDEVFECSSCSQERPFFDIARSAARYSGVVEALVQDFKYHRATWLTNDLASLMLTCFRTHLPREDIDAVTYIPLYPTKERERSYNQAGLLAQRIAAHFHKALYHNMVHRTRPTRSQTHLTASERTANVKNIFAVKRERALKGLSVLLVDDVMTTGATVNECARVLKGAGARKVVVLTVARG